MNRTQIYNILNSVAKQAFGETAVTVTDTSWVSYGDQVLTSKDSKDAWYSALWDVIGRDVIAIRVYRAEEDGLYRDPIEWGAMLRKISYKDITASENATWTDGNESPFERFDNDIVQKIFAKASTWEFDLSRPDVQLKTAFKSPEAMGAYLDGLMTALNNSIEFAIKNAANLARANLIAKTLTDDKGLTCHNVLALYNKQSGKNLTFDNCMQSLEFLLFVVATIKLTVARMSQPNKLYNDGEITRFGSGDEIKIYTLAELDSAIDMILRRESYHLDGINLPDHTTVPYWQGAGTDYSLMSTSTVSVSNTDESGTTTMTHSGVLALVCDREALGITVDNRRTNSIYNPRKEFTNFFAKADIGYFNDLSEMHAVFYIADTTASTVSLDMDPKTAAKNAKAALNAIKEG